MEQKLKLKEGLPVINAYAAGIDVGDTQFDVATFNEHDGHVSKQYKCFTTGLHEIVSDLKDAGINTVAMESTGVYWLNLYLLLEEAGIEPYLVNAKHVKNVTGRKKDGTDAIWIQKLHSCGLLQKSFQPEGKIRELRAYTRHRKKLLELGSDCVRRMQKSMELMNLKLHTVISDILGKTGLQIVKAIIDGERDPDVLIQYKGSRIKADDDTIKKSLEGIWKEEYLFMLEQAYQGYMFYQSQKTECDKKIEQNLLSQVAQVCEGDISDVCKKKPKKNQYCFDARKMMNKIAGIDLCNIDGISEATVVELISETGTDMNKWYGQKNFSAWLNLVPNTKITGGKIISSKMEKKKNRAGQALQMAASGLSQSNAPIGDYARKMKARLGKKGGIVATAHKLSRIIYTIIKYQCEYNPATMETQLKKWKLVKISRLEKQLSQLKSEIIQDADIANVMN